MDGDEHLIDQVLEGKLEAFEELVARHRSYVFGIVAKHGPYEMAEALAHEVFVQAYRSLPSLRDKGAFRGWLASIAVRQCYDFFRARSRRRELPMSSLSRENEAWLDGVENAEAQRRFENDESRAHAAEVLDWALDRLTPEERLVVTLVNLEERPVREAAKLLGWSTANVKIRAFRARQKLRRLIEERGNE